MEQARPVRRRKALLRAEVPDPGRRFEGVRARQLRLLRLHQELYPQLHDFGKQFRLLRQPHLQARKLFGDFRTRDDTEQLRQQRKFDRKHQQAPEQQLQLVTRLVVRLEQRRQLQQRQQQPLTQLYGSVGRRFFAAFILGPFTQLRRRRWRWNAQRRQQLQPWPQMMNFN